ncbi:MAG TPA: hypothetical protein VF166_10860 [Gemmatimonadaceae bacterium]
MADSRAARAGTPPQVIARQLGHVNAVLVLKVYAQFFPNSDERDRWERKAAELDAKVGVTPESAVVPPEDSITPQPPVKASRQKIAWPSVDELLEMLAAASTKAVAGRLGVSDIALRKHLAARGVTKFPDGRRRGISRPRTETKGASDAATESTRTAESADGSDLTDAPPCKRSA